MAVKYTKPKGTLDILPSDVHKWHYVENLIHQTAHLYGYEEIRLPTFESTELFARGVGEGTDIVSKEMYTFLDKGGRSITLRPEGTAGVVRAVLENGLLSSSPLPLKNYYLQSCFRYENSQKGRYREFHQFGIECFGTSDPSADVETMLLARSLFQTLELNADITLEINSIGCPTCRPTYLKELTAYFEEYKSTLCPTCLERLEKNPMRLLDCKEEKCHAISANAPRSVDYLCEECDDHFSIVKSQLDGLGLPYVVNTHMVRGLDYYTKTVFEFIANGVGTQGTVCAGGRYDGLIQELGGAPTPGVGFGMGVERVIMLLEQKGNVPSASGPVMFAVGMGDSGRAAARKLAYDMRRENLQCEYDISARSVKAQMKAAGRLNAQYTMVLGDEEISSGIARIKRMSDGSQAEISLDKVSATLKNLHKKDPTSNCTDDLQTLVDGL